MPEGRGQVLEPTHGKVPYVRSSKLSVAEDPAATAVADGDDLLQ
jgi:hypothetical protein